MTDPPPRQLPSISEDTVVRAKVKLSTLMAILATIGTGLGAPVPPQ